LNISSSFKVFCLSTASPKFELIQIFTIQGQPRTAEGSNSQEYTRQQFFLEMSQA
jgi:hypothetical protein